jgi:hypothetical protein
VVEEEVEVEVEEVVMVGRHDDAPEPMTEPLRVLILSFPFSPSASAASAPASTSVSPLTPSPSPSLSLGTTILSAAITKRAGAWRAGAEKGRQRGSMMRGAGSEGMRRR